MSRYGLDLQLQIYGAQTPPAFPIGAEEWEERARTALTPEAYGYVAGGAGAEETMRANREAFYRRRLRPRMLRDTSDRDLSVRVLGTDSPGPVFLAPVGVLSIVHPDAELAVARAAGATGIPVILSTVSSYTIEEVATTLGETPRWFQLYPGKDDELMVSMVRRAEAAGYSALVVTVDTPMLGRRERDLRHAYLPFLQGQGLANFLSDPVFRAGLAQPPEENPQAAIVRFLDVFVNPAFTWDGVAFLRAQTRLPILIKGITHPDDARLALDHGVDGVIVSNHGGRQVDGAVAALDALPEIRAVAGDTLPVLFDGGIRRGADVLKACALGANAVLLGRPYVYGLAVGGADGVAQVIRTLLADVDLELALSGYSALGDLDGIAVTTVE